MPAVLAAFESVMDRGVQEQRKMMLMLRLASRMEQILSDHREMIVWPTAIADEFERCTLKFCQLSTDLSQHFHARGEMLFGYTIKYH